MAEIKTQAHDRRRQTVQVWDTAVSLPSLKLGDLRRLIHEADHLPDEAGIFARKLNKNDYRGAENYYWVGELIVEHDERTPTPARDEPGTTEESKHG